MRDQVVATCFGDTPCLISRARIIVGQGDRSDRASEDQEELCDVALLPLRAPDEADKPELLTVTIMAAETGCPNVTKFQKPFDYVNKNFLPVTFSVTQILPEFR